MNKTLFGVPIPEGAVKASIKPSAGAESPNPSVFADPKIDIANLVHGTAGNLIPDMLTKYRAMGDAALKAFADLAIAKLTESWLKGKKEKKYVQELFAAAKRTLP